MNSKLKNVINIVKKGGIIIFPTDTAFGIGCRIDDEKLVKKLFETRRRPKEKAVPVLVSSIKMAEEYADINETAKTLIQKHWPGGLTVVVNAKLDKTNSLVRGGGKTIGLRMPKHSTTLKLIQETGIPIIGSSANFAGEATPYKQSDLNSDLVKLVDAVLPGRCSVKLSSTVVDCTGDNIKILRQGAVKL